MRRVTATLLALLLGGCTVQPTASLPPVEVEPSGVATSDFTRAPGAPANRHAGRILSVDPPLVRLTDQGRLQPPGASLVARGDDLRPAALLRAEDQRGGVARVTLLRGALRVGMEVVEPSPALEQAAAALVPVR